MKNCCGVPTVATHDQRRFLRLVLWINAAMFLVECGAGVAAHSSSLLADSVDMLGDALVYGVSLYAIGRGDEWLSRAARLKGTVMAAFAAGVLAEVAGKLVGHAVPSAPVMGGIGLLALTANVLCLALLSRRRRDDVNMRSAWLCSRNDVLANGGVLLAAAGVGLTGLPWPDIAVGLAIASIFLSSGIGVLRDARRAAGPAPVGG